MRDALENVLRSIDRPAIAVSGGVDSVTLANDLLQDVLVMHAVSPAVPVEATERVQRLAAARGWRLTIVSAGEFDDPDYRANPVNRCFYCKTNLYGTIRATTDRPILSGANVDDLGEYRPGLDAARNPGVRHPYIEANVDKKSLRAISRELGLTEVAELPSSPCLSSRVETGIRIEPSTLAFIHTVERIVARQTGAATVRCRIRAGAIVIELDHGTLAALADDGAEILTAAVEAVPRRPGNLPIHIEAYRNGSAFLVRRELHGL